MPRSTMRPAVDHQQLVGLAHRGEAVRDDEGGAAGQRLAQGALHGRLGLGVQVRRGLVEHHDVGRLEEQPGQGDTLLLAAREPVAPLADDGVEAVGQLADQVPDLGLGQRVQDVGLARLGTGVHEVGPQRVVEEVGVLGHHADHVAHRGHGGVPHVDAAEAHRPRRHVVEARHQVRDGRLARPRRAHQRHHVAGLDGEGDVVEDLAALAGLEHRHRLERGQRDLFGTRVGEVDVLERDGGVAPRDVDGVGVLFDHGLDVEDLEDALEGDEGGHDVEVDVRELGQRLVEAGQVAGQRDDGTDLQLTVDRGDTAEAVDERRGQRRRQGERDEEHRE